MAFYSDGIIKAIKATSDVYGSINEGQIALMNLLDPQWMNNYEILIYPQDLSKGSAKDIALAVASSAVDFTIARLHIQKISVANIEFEAVSVNGMKHITEIKHPDEISITFVENDIGLVRNYLQYWMNQIAIPNDGISKIMQSKLSLSGAKGITEAGAMKGVDPSLVFDYRFKDNQIGAKKNAKIIPQMGTGLPSPAWIQMEGLVYKGISEFSFDQGAGEPMMIDAKFHVDVVRIMCPANLLNG